MITRQGNTLSSVNQDVRLECPLVWIHGKTYHMFHLTVLSKMAHKIVR